VGSAGRSECSKQDRNLLVSWLRVLQDQSELIASVWVAHFHTFGEEEQDPRSGIRAPRKGDCNGKEEGIQEEEDRYQESAVDPWGSRDPQVLARQQT